MTWIAKSMKTTERTSHSNQRITRVLKPTPALNILDHSVATTEETKLSKTQIGATSRGNEM